MADGFASGTRRRGATRTGNTGAGEATQRPRPRGPVFRIVEPTLQQLRAKLRRGPERNIFVTKSGNLQLSEFAVFDGDRVDTAIITSCVGAQRLHEQRGSHPDVKVIVAGEGGEVDLASAMKTLRQEFGIKYLLCEGGPQLYGAMVRSDLIDEKFLTISPMDVGQESLRAEECAMGAAGGPADDLLRKGIYQGAGDTLAMAELQKDGRSAIQPLQKATVVGREGALPIPVLCLEDEAIRRAVLPTSAGHE